MAKTSSRICRLVILSSAILLFLGVEESVSQKLNPNETAPNFIMSTVDGPLIYKGPGTSKGEKGSSASTGNTVKGPMIFHAFSSYSGFLEALWNKDSSILDLIDNSPDNTNYVFLNAEEDPHKTAVWMKSRFESILQKYYTIAKSLERCDISKPVNADRRSFSGRLLSSPQKRRHLFPKPHRRMRRSSSDFDFDDHEEFINMFKRRPKVVRNNKNNHHNINKKWRMEMYKKRNNVEHFHNAGDIFTTNDALSANNVNIRHDDDQVLKGSLVSTMYEYLSEDENEHQANTENCHDDALQKRVAEIVTGGLPKLKENWMKRLHFVNQSVLEVGNFIPLVLSRWYCSGHGCGLDQVAVELKEEGAIKMVSKRLDGRYDWLTSPYNIKSKRPKVIHIGDGCDNKTEVKYTDNVILISNDGSCSYFQKLKNAQDRDALGAIIYAKKGETLFDMTCQNTECETEMKLPGTMIPYEDGIKMKALIESNKDVYVKFQHTPWWNFFMGIDEQGKLQEVGWLVYPSMIFLSYQAKWLNYVSSLLHDIHNMKEKEGNKEITVFQGRIMQGNRGVVAFTEFEDSVFKDIPRFGHIYLDMALGCPGSTDFSCPHWDHTVQLYLNCDDQTRVQRRGPKGKRKKPARLGPEIGRWITPFRRRIGRWLTDIRPLAPLFTSKTCTFTMKTVPWAMPWKPSLKLWFTDKKEGSIDAPMIYEELFRGGTFNGSYNQDMPSGRRKKILDVPKNVTKAMLFSTITGHGSDNNNCAEFCVTAHHFQINDNDNERVFDNAGTATGCADRVSEGSAPNEHGTWLYGRNGWCDGENVGPWIEDVTKQIRPGEKNIIKYKGLFNNKTPEPKGEPGNIIMYSYIVFYTKTDEN